MKSLYLQYQLDGKYIRRYGEIQNKTHFLLVSVPGGASEVSYGWYFENFHEKKEFNRPSVFDANSLVKEGLIYLIDRNNGITPL